MHPIPLQMCKITLTELCRRRSGVVCTRRTAALLRQQSSIFLKSLGIEEPSLFSDEECESKGQSGEK